MGYIQTQTDELALIDAEEMRSELSKKDGVIEDLRKTIEELKQQIIKRDRCMEACKETIRKLLIEQSTMERKQVSCFFVFHSSFSASFEIFSPLFFLKRNGPAVAFCVYGELVVISLFIFAFIQMKKKMSSPEDSVWTCFLALIIKNTSVVGLPAISTCIIIKTHVKSVYCVLIVSLRGFAQGRPDHLLKFIDAILSELHARKFF